MCRVQEEDYEAAAAQRDAIFETKYSYRRFHIGEKMALEALRREAIEWKESGLTPEEWKLVRRKRMMNLGVIPYDLIRYRSPFRKSYTEDI